MATNLIPIPDKYLSLLEKYPKIMKLRVFVDSKNPLLKGEYEKRVEQHNEKLLSHPNHIDAGFDLLCPYKQDKNVGSTKFTLDTEIKCAAEMIYDKADYYKSYNTGYYLYPRSSITKRPFILANSVGIIDASYRGNLKAIFNIGIHYYTGDVGQENINIPFYDEFDRYVQICAPDLSPIYVELVESLSELGEETARGEGGFGSTGK